MRTLLEELHRLNQQAFESNRVFAETLRTELDGLGLTVQELDDSASLKRVLHLTANSVTAHLTEKTQQDQTRQQQFEQGMAGVTAKLADLENTLDKEATTTSSADSLDPLTGCPRWGAYETEATAVFARCQQQDNPLSLVFFGVDQLLEINNRLGHKAGDQVLRVIAKLIRQELGNSSQLVRYGGGEFVCLLEQTGLGAAQEVGKRIRQMVRDFRFHSKGNRICIGLSCGVAQSEPQDDSIESLLARSYSTLQAARNDAAPGDRTGGAVTPARAG